MQGGNREPKVAIIQKSRGNNKGGIKSKDGKSPTITSSSWQTNNHITYDNGVRWRALTPIECERLMTMEDNSTLHGIDDKGNQKTISKTQRYKMLGNGWVIDTIAHCLKYLEGRI